MEEAFRLFKSTREYFTPVLTESAFHDKGMLTPEEFVKAGDQLIRNCPSWKWECGEPSKVRPYLPADKQFLSTKGVPSYSRVSVLQSSKVVEEHVKGGMGEAEGDWCAPELIKPDENDTDEVLVEAEDATEDVATGVEKAEPPTSTAEDEYLDMEDESLALDDAATSMQTLKIQQSGQKALPGSSFPDSVTSNLVRARRYDVSITYDNYYRTPRIWLFGFDENGSALSTREIYQVLSLFRILNKCLRVRSITSINVPLKRILCKTTRTRPLQLTLTRTSLGHMVRHLFNNLNDGCIIPLLSRHMSL